MLENDVSVKNDARWLKSSSYGVLNLSVCCLTQLAGSLKVFLEGSGVLNR